jgi:hypothetical protein
VTPVKVRAVIALATLTQLALFLAKWKAFVGFYPGR